ncbi:MAG: MinD/ParA family protein [Magnetococcales bacterium]|nr:MinD/ParA family protein [Magnetococcales bacterium]
MIEDLDNQVATLKEWAKKAEQERKADKLRDDAKPVSTSVLARRLAERKVPYTLAVTSGKGGVGKTLVTVNLALSFARQGLKVLVIDADLGLANVDVVLGLTPQYTIEDVLAGRMTIDNVAVPGPEGITVLPAASGVAGLSSLTEAQRISLMDHIDHWNADFDMVLVDTGAGISSNVRYFILSVERILVVATPDPASITDAYALMKVMFMNHRIDHFDLVVNQVRAEREALDVYRTLHRVADRFLSIGLNFAGAVPYDEQLVQSVRRQIPVTMLFPESPSAKAFSTLSANVLDRWHRDRERNGQALFFWRRVLDESVPDPLARKSPLSESG